MKKKHIWVPLLGIIIFYILLYLAGIHTTCYIKAFTGIPCPGCGMTRAYLSLLQGNIKGAFYYHPLFLLPPALVILMLLSYWKHFKIAKWIWFILLLVIIGTYVVRMILMFPKVAPMDFYGGAFLPKIYHFLLRLFHAGSQA